VRNRAALAAKKKKKSKTTSDSDDEEHNPSEKNKPKNLHDEDPAFSGGSKEDASDSDDLVADTDHEAEFSEMEDANKDEDHPMADPESVLLGVSKKESVLEKAICAAGLVAKDEVCLDDDVEDEGCIWCGDVREHEHKSFVTESMNERNLIFDDIDSLKRHATCFLHPEQPLCVDPLLMA